MNTLYKYSNLLPLEYFDNPTIKISITEFLNDPFECNASENIFHSIGNHLQKLGLSEETIDHGKKAYKESIGIMLSINGIVSLSETPRNSLMWAHYAQQHHGICIGYKSDFLKHIQGSDAFQILINEPRKVNYDNLRFESDFFYENSDQIDKDAIIQHLFKKSDEWIYEKEHRCIIPYIKASHLIVLSENPKVDYNIWPERKTDKSRMKVGDNFDKVINVALETNMLSKTEIKNKYKLNHENITSARLSLLQTSKDCLFLLDIDKKSIESIYFGCKVSNSTIKPYFEKLHKEYNLYKFTLSKKRFELIPQLLTADMFN